jgi:hypothetical protein
MESVDAGAVARALAALVALLGLPGLTVVRAPWVFVPFLSLSFWIITWPWLEALHATRQRFVLGALLFFALLALLRLPRLSRDRPHAATLLVVLAALAPLGLLARVALPLGDEGPLRALTVRLLVWRDGLPRTYEPLLPLRSFGADLHAVDLLAADVALLGDVPPVLAALAASLAAPGLLLLAVHAGLARAGHDRGTASAVVLALSAILGACAGSQVLPGPAVPAALGAALVCAAVAILVRGEGRSPAVAAGLIAGAAAASDAWFLLFALPLAAARLLWLSQASRPSARRRVGLAAGCALVLALPAWARCDAPAVPWAALVYTLPHALAAALPLSAHILAAVTRRWRTDSALPLLALGAVTVAAWGVVHVRPATPPVSSDVALFEELARSRSITSVTCIEAGSPHVWMPAVVGRAVWPLAGPRAYEGTLRVPSACVLPAP